MSDFDFNFDNSTEDTSTEKREFKLLPDGDYGLTVHEVEMRTSKAGNVYLNVQYKVNDESYKNRRIFDMFNLYHPREDVKDIAIKRFKTLIEACGLPLTIKNRSELVRKTLKAKIETLTDADYGDKNIIKYYIKKEASDLSDFPF